jgi:hypothetical protein
MFLATLDESMVGMMVEVYSPSFTAFSTSMSTKASIAVVSPLEALLLSLPHSPFVYCDAIFDSILPAKTGFFIM